MKKEKADIVSCFTIWLVLASFLAPAMGQSRSRAKYNVDTSVPTFRYIIVSNEIDAYQNPKLNRRVIQVLMDERAFSEKTLRALFSLVSKRFPRPESLYVDVATSLEQLRRQRKAIMA